MRVILVPFVVLLGLVPLQAAEQRHAPGHPPKNSVDSLSYNPPPKESVSSESAPTQGSTGALRAMPTRPGQQTSGPGPQIVPVIEPMPALRGSIGPTLN